MDHPATCPQCGSDALATVVSTDSSGARQLRTYCQACQSRGIEEERNELRWLGTMLARLLFYGGVVLAVLTAITNYLPLGGRSGFGWRQITGVEIGCIAILLGLLARRGLLAVSGLFLLLISLTADFLRLGQTPGLFGWKARLGMVAATAMLVGGIVWRRALERRMQPAGH